MQKRDPVLHVFAVIIENIWFFLEKTINPTEAWNSVQVNYRRNELE
jgi:hypothetical protein